MRGISYKINGTKNKFRFNPAYAGNIKQFVHKHKQNKVQPRVCGEYFTMKILSGSVLGSTPRMRGIFGDWNVEEVQHRFNPAYAGNMLLDKTKYSAS